MYDFLTLKAFAKVELGLSFDEFHSLTPTELSEFIKLWERKQARAEMVGLMSTTMLANIHRDSKKNREGFDPRDFMIFFKDVYPKPDKKKNVTTNLNKFYDQWQKV